MEEFIEKLVDIWRDIDIIGISNLLFMEFPLSYPEKKNFLFDVRSIFNEFASISFLFEQMHCYSN